MGVAVYHHNKRYVHVNGAHGFGFPQYDRGTIDDDEEYPIRGGFL